MRNLISTWCCHYSGHLVHYLNGKHLVITVLCCGNWRSEEISEIQASFWSELAQNVLLSHIMFWKSNTQRHVVSCDNYGCTAQRIVVMNLLSLIFYHSNRTLIYIGVDNCTKHTLSVSLGSCYWWCLVWWPWWWIRATSWVSTRHGCCAIPELFYSTTAGSGGSLSVWIAAVCGVRAESGRYYTVPGI